MYELVRYFRRVHEIPACASRSVNSGGEVADDQVADHAAVPGGVVRDEIAVEERAERVAVGDPEHAERADDHVHVERVDSAGDAAVGAAAGEDRVDQLDGRRAELVEVG